MLLKRICAVILIILLLVLPYTSLKAATNITLDGNFEDWADKPALADAGGDEVPSSDITKVKWYPNVSDGNLYFYAERLSGVEEDKTNKFEDWNFDLYLTGDMGQRKATIEFHPPSQFVEVKVYDDKGRYLWSEKGKWGDDQEPGTRVEFEIPFEYLVGSISAGYEVKTYFVSQNDRVPDDGNISISTVSTFPIVTMSGVAIVCFILFIVFKRRGLKVTRL